MPRASRRGPAGRRPADLGCGGRSGQRLRPASRRATIARWIARRGPEVVAARSTGVLAWRPRRPGGGRPPRPCQPATNPTTTARSPSAGGGSWPSRRGRSCARSATSASACAAPATRRRPTRRRRACVARGRRPRPRRRRADGEAHLHHAQPQPGGVVASTGSRPATTRWDIVAHRARPVARRGDPGAVEVHRASSIQQMTAGFAAPRGPAAIPGPMLRGEVGDVLARALPQRPDEASTRRSRCTPTGSSTTPSTTASTSATSPAPAASSGRARSSPTRGRRRPTASASGLTTTTGPTTRSTRSAGCSARSSCAPRARGARTTSTSSSSTRCSRRSPA